MQMSEEERSLEQAEKVKFVQEILVYASNTSTRSNREDVLLHPKSFNIIIPLALVRTVAPTVPCSSPCAKNQQP
jgi:hypothetical protein